MSQRAIAAAMSTSQDTVRRAISGERNRSPEPEVRHDLDDVLREAGIDPDELDDEPQTALSARPVIGTDGKARLVGRRCSDFPACCPGLSVAVTDRGDRLEV